MSTIEYRCEDHVAWVTLNRPQAMNAINAEMDHRLAEVWADINVNRDVWVTVLTAAGERAFCAGGDVKGNEGGPQPRVAFAGGLTGVGGPLLTLRTPLIAAVQGYVLGGGLELALCADIIVAAETTQFGMPETKVGIIGESGVMHRAIRQLPHRIAMAMILTGERLNAASALQHGLVNDVVPMEQLAKATQVWVDRILAASPLAVQAAKHTVNAGLRGSLESALGARYEPIEAYALSSDLIEGAAAMTERRKPKWTGT